MDISSVGGVDSADYTANKTLGKEDFLNLLLNQLSHQDPLNPLDSTEFTAQLTQFSSLEELNNINSTLNDVLAFQQSMQNAAVINLIGTTVKVSGNSVYLSGTADISYELSTQASSVKISILDGSGKLVHSEELGTQAAGKNSYLWDGKDGSGSQLEEGAYTFEIEALNSSGSSVETVTKSSGTVTDILYEGGITYIVLNGDIKVHLSEIESIGL
jgi:flagellar basal-body rod modification protein FlgD